jgi:hypothetical protein
MSETASRRRRLLTRVFRPLAVLVAGWLVVAYVILPALWRHYEHHPAMEYAPRIAVTKQGIPGDPLNVGLVGGEDVLIRSMLEAGWKPADPVTFRSSLKIAGSVLLGRDYSAAPVSDLFVFGRKQDLAFEQPVGGSARRRHHVRFWRSDALGRDGSPLWIGAATFDRSVGFSRFTGQVTHHIAPDVDADRDALLAGLRAAGWLTELFQVTGVGSTLAGRNGGGDRYYTDGELSVGVLATSAAKDRSPERLENPATVRIKEQLWTAIRPLLDGRTPP